MADPVINEEVAHEVDKARIAKEKAHEEADAESKENQRAGILIVPSLVEGIMEVTNLGKKGGQDVGGGSAGGKVKEGNDKGCCKDGGAGCGGDCGEKGDCGNATGGGCPCGKEGGC